MESDAGGLDRQLREAEHRAAIAEARADALTAELSRTTQSYVRTLMAVLVMAVVALVVLGAVAFNAVDGMAPS